MPFLEVARERPSSADEHTTTRDDDQQNDDERVVYYNSVSLAAPSGTIAAHYRKNSPWPTPEQSWATAGKDVACADTEYGRVGLAICFDIHSVLAKYARHRLWALLYPIAWVGGETREWFRIQLPELLRRCRCPHYVVGCNWSTDAPREWPGAGFTTHYGPRGELLASTNDDVGSTIVYSTLWTDQHVPPAVVAGGLDLDEYADWTRRVGNEAKEWRWY